MRILWLLLTLVFILFIFANSSLSAGDSGRLSAAAADIVMKMGDMVNVTFSGDLEHQIRKLAHFIEFAALGWLLCKTYGEFSVSKRTANGYILLIGLFVAVVDEYIQLFSYGRSSQVTDVLLDFSGVVCMWLAYRIWQWSKH